MFLELRKVRTRLTTKKIRHCLENHKKDIMFGFLKMVMKVNANIAENQRIIEK